MFDTIEQAIADLQQGKLIVLVDDEYRENEGDLVALADTISYEGLNFMTTHGRGLICVPLSSDIAKRLNLDPMVQHNTEVYRTAFTLSVDAIENVTTGISVADRLHTIRLLANPDSTANELAKPGHMFPLIAKDAGVLQRQGHTEAAVDLAKLAGKNPVGVICEILKDDGTMARRDDLIIFCRQHNLKMINIQDLVLYRKRHENLLSLAAEAQLPTAYGEFRIMTFYHPTDGSEHIALVMGDITNQADVLVRVHSECFTGDVLSSLKCDCGDQLDLSLQHIAQHGSGVLIYLRQEGRGIGLINKIRAYKLQEQGFDTVDANLQLGLPEDARDYYMASQMLKFLQVQSVRLLTNNQLKVDGLQRYGIVVSQREALEIAPNAVNQSYLKTKKERMQHQLSLF